MKEICGAKKRDQSSCQKPPLKGAKRCRLHGGKTPRGIASPHFKTGGESKYLIALASRLHKAFADLRRRNDLLELGDEIALIDLQIQELVKHMYDGAPSAVWQEAQKAFNEFQAARATGKLDQMQYALTKLEAIFGKDYVTDNRKEVGEWLEKRRKFVESERKRMIEQQEMITAQEAALLFSALTSVIQKFVPDRETREKIQEEFIRLTAPYDGSDFIN